MAVRFLLVLIPLAALLGSLCMAAPATSPATKPVTLYDSHPDHLWNRLHTTLLVRPAPDGQQFGEDALDPLFWPRTKYLLEAASHQRAIAVLDEFIRTHGESLIDDPLKHAILQRDLWAVFDWSADPAGHG